LGTGNETLFGGNGNDSLYGNSSGNYLMTGGNGDDFLQASGSGNETLVGGGNGNSTLFGAGSGTYSLVGGNGNDLLGALGTGNETLFGGRRAAPAPLCWSSPATAATLPFRHFPKLNDHHADALGSSPRGVCFMSPLRRYPDAAKCLSLLISDMQSRAKQLLLDFFLSLALTPVPIG
jgi:hypothetical protein